MRTKSLRPRPVGRPKNNSLLQASKFADPLVLLIQSTLEPSSFDELDQLSSYLHMPGEPNTFGPPGVSLRLNRKRSELVTRCVLGGNFVEDKRSREARLDAMVEGTIDVLRAVFGRYGKSRDDLPVYEAALEALQSRAGGPGEKY